MKPRMIRYSRLGFLLILSCLVLTEFRFAQVPPTKTDLKVTEPEDDIRVDTSLVDVSVSVFGKDRKLVTTLVQDDFVIFENGVEQRIEYFANVEQPFTVVLLMDLSGSMQNNLEQIKSASLKFIDQLRPTDRIEAIVFNEGMHVLNTNLLDRETLRKEIKRLEVYRSGTFLYPVVEVVSQRVLKRLTGRKALVLFTDGIDGTPLPANGIRKSTYETSLREAVSSSALVYCIKFGSDVAIYDKIANAYLNDLAEQTGGKVFRDNLSTSFQNVAEELRRQYSIGYYPQTIAKKNEVRKIEVRIKKPGLIVRSRNVYIGR
ncbi:MAG: VWA domain-containing protein [Pyrinomonadaceae bacterium]